MYTGLEFRVFPYASSYKWLNIFRNFEQVIINYFSILLPTDLLLSPSSIFFPIVVLGLY